MSTKGEGRAELGLPSEKQPVSSLEIKNTKLRRTAIIVATWLAERVKLGLVNKGAQISPGLRVKCGPRVRLEEAANMEFVRQRTTIPVPKVYCAFERKGSAYLLMDYVPGRPLYFWWRNATPEARYGVVQELKGYMTQLRLVANPKPNVVGGVTGGSIYDFRYTEGENIGFGPFDSPREFHKWLRFGFSSPVSTEIGPLSESQTLLERLCRLQDRREYETKLTHGDLNTFNIIINKDHVAAIIDWEMAGWYPDYWEYTANWHGIPWDEYWRPQVEDIHGSHKFTTELEAENIRRLWFQTPY